MVMVAIIAFLAVWGVMAASDAVTAQSNGEGAASAAPSNLTVSWVNGFVILAWTRGTDTSYLKQVAMHREVDASWDTWRGGTLPTDYETIFYPSTDRLTPGATYVFRIGGAKMVDGLLQPVAFSNEVAFTIVFRVGGAKMVDGLLQPVAFSNEVAFTIPGGTTEGEAAGAPAPAPTAAPTPEPAAVPATAAASPPAQRHPSALSAEVVNGQVVLSWAPGTDARIVKQVVKRRVPRGRWTDVALGVSANGYTDTTVQPGQRYIYRIQGQRSNGRGPISNVARVAVR